MKLSSLIKATRESKQWTQKQLADKLGVTPGYISNWENEHAQPDKYLDELEEILEVPLQIGRWLRQTRQERNVTVKDLANESGYSKGYIYNIENGHIVNPNPETILALCVAMGVENTPLGLISDESTKNKGESIIGEHYSADLENLDEVAGIPGIYIFWSANDLPIYVGQSGDIARRIGQHRDKFWFRDPVVFSLTYIEIGDEEVRKSVERILIELLDSSLIINKV